LPKLAFSSHEFNVFLQTAIHNSFFKIKIILFLTCHRLREFENKVLRGIFGPKRDEVTGYWRKLLNEDLHNLYSSPNIVRMIKSRRMRWAGHAARMGRRGLHIEFGGEARGKETTKKTKT
jgi:hypothetical protein